MISVVLNMTWCRMVEGVVAATLTQRRRRRWYCCRHILEEKEFQELASPTSYTQHEWLLWRCSKALDVCMYVGLMKSHYSGEEERARTLPALPKQHSTLHTCFFFLLGSRPTWDKSHYSPLSCCSYKYPIYVFIPPPNKYFHEIIKK